MITTITLYTVVCDLCEKELDDEYEESPILALDNAESQDWYIIHGKHICPDCIGDKPEPVFVNPNQLSLF